MVDFHANRYWDDPKLKEQEVVSDTHESDLANFEKMAAVMSAANKARRKAKAEADAKARAEKAAAEAAEEAKGADPAAGAGEGAINAAEPLAPPPAGGDEWETVVEERYDAPVPGPGQS